MAQRSCFENITDQLTREIPVTGINDQMLRSELLRKPDLTLVEAAHACRLAEFIDPLNSQPETETKSINLTGFTRTRTQTENSRFMPTWHLIVSLNNNAPIAIICITSNCYVQLMERPATIVRKLTISLPPVVPVRRNPSARNLIYTCCSKTKTPPIPNTSSTQPR